VAGVWRGSARDGRAGGPGALGCGHEVRWWLSFSGPAVP